MIIDNSHCGMISFNFQKKTEEVAALPRNNIKQNKETNKKGVLKPILCIGDKLPIRHVDPI